MRDKSPGLFLLLLVTIAFHFISPAQYYTSDSKDYQFEAGISLGGMACITDLGGPRGKGGYYLNEINWQNTQPAAGIFAQVLYKNIVGVKLEVTIGGVNAYDSILKGIATQKAIGRYERNLSFKSGIKEVSLMAEFYPQILIRNYENYLPRLMPYITAGFGIFSFNPKAPLNGEWVPLQPLSTEGQGFAEYPDRKVYSLTQTNVPFGGGVRYEFKRFNLRMEFINRALFTDYLDDVSKDYIDPDLFDKHLEKSQAAKARVLYNRSFTATGSTIKRGNVKNNDSYLSVNVKLSVKLGSGDSFLFNRNRSGIGCKTW